MIAGTGSGCGKTTITCALLSAFNQRGIRAASFKSGPDYIDPMFHREVLGTPSYNLDSYFCDRDTLCYLLDRCSTSADIAVIEGAMGFYDGDSGSAFALSEQTETPVIIVIDCKGMQASIGAVMQGFLQYKTPNRIAGFLFNRLPERLIPYVQQLCSDLHTTCFGVLPRQKADFPSRHLGLVTAAEITGIQQQMHALGQAALQYFDLDLIMRAAENPLPQYQAPQIPRCNANPVIAVAKDEAFCFLYTESLDLLRDMGCEIRFFSPIHDTHLPDADGLILCGGYPELHAKALSENTGMRSEIRTAILSGMPAIAECGGFMYLHTSLQTKSGAEYPMADVISGTVFPTDSLQRFGYISMKSQQIYFYSDIQAAFRFAEAAAKYGAKHGTNQTNQTAR